MGQGFFPGEYSMKLRTFVFLFITIYLLLNSGCQQNPTEPTQPKTSTVSGTVLDKGSSKPIPLALVYDIGALAKVDTSKTDGTYTLTMDLTSNYNTSIFAKASGYASDTQSVSLKPGDNLTGINIHMTVTDSNAIVSGISGRAASIVLKSPSPGTIALKGTGINETAMLTFIVKDSAGNPVVGTHSCLVNFRLVARPDSFTSLSPTSARTNLLTGEVSTTVSAGITPGVLQVIAQVSDSTRKDTVKASPIFLSVGGGLPDSAGVSMGRNPLNIAGRVYANLTSTITVYVNDRWKNPVADGTQVSFIATAGSVVSSTTTQGGLASVTLRSTMNPPANPMVTVTATTNGDKSYIPSDSVIVRKKQVLFSGPTAPIALDTSTTNRFNIPYGGASSFNFRVADDLGFPIVAGSTVSLTIDGADTLTKNLSVVGLPYTFPDEQTQIFPNYNFTVTIIDKLLSGGASGPITIGIHVVSTNGNTDCWFGGNVLSKGQVTTSNGPASIAAADTLPKRLYLLETQKPDTLTKVTFIVKDAYGNPMQSSNKAQVQIFLSGAPAGVHFYPKMITQPYWDSTDAKGNVSVMVTSGNTPGTFTVHAQTINGVNVYDAYSVPIIVRHGLPDSDFISCTIKKNIFNPIRSIKVGTFTLNLEDYTSDIPAPSNVFFSITGGSIGAMAISDSNSGQAVVNIFGGSEPSDPILGPGWGYIKPTLLVHGGSTITKFFPFLFTYAPQIAFTNMAVMDTARDTLLTPLGDGQSVNVDFAVWDKNKNPISSANSITITAIPSQEIVLSGDINLANLNDTQLPADAIHHFSIQNKTGGVSGPFSVTITVTGESGSAVKTLTGYLMPPVQAQKVQLTNATMTTINVKGSGSNESSVLTFQVTNNTNVPIDGNNPVYVTVGLLDTAGAPSVSPNVPIKTDSIGKISATLYSGNKYGTVRVIASFVNPITGSTVVSQPYSFIIDGPDISNFSLSISKNNLPGVGTLNQVGTITAFVADKVGSPLPSSSIVNFQSISGAVRVGNIGMTDANGVAITAISGGPTPNEPTLGGIGYGYIQASVVAERGTILNKTIPFLFSGPPKTLVFTDATGAPTSSIASASNIKPARSNPKVKKVAGTTGTSTLITPMIDGSTNSDLFQGAGCQLASCIKRLYNICHC